MATGITARLSALRKEKGISQKEAAAGLGVSQALLSHYETEYANAGLIFSAARPTTTMSPRTTFGYKRIEARL